MLTVTRDKILPTTITGSYPRPHWFDRSLAGRSFKSALGDSLFREQYLDAVASIIAEQEAAGLDIVTDGDSRFDLTVGGKSWFFYPIERLGGVCGHRDTSRGWMSRHGLRPGKILWEVQEAYQPGVVREKLTRGPLEYAALWQVAQRMTDRPVKFGTICAPAIASMLWNEYYEDDKTMILELCDIMNEELREVAQAGCPLIQVEEPPHHMRAQQPDCSDADLQFLTEAFNRQLTGVDAEIWVHTCWGNPNQQRVHWKVPSYERALEHLLQLNCDVLTIECASSDGQDRPLQAHQDRQKDRDRRSQSLRYGGGACRACRRVDPQGAGIYPQRTARHQYRLRFRPRGTVAADCLLQVRGAGRGHQHRTSRAGAARGSRAAGRSDAVVRRARGQELM
ncbi:MAG: hypothetical protein R3D67_15890 [Hyphomicrobiaceae bacterium]